MAMYLARVSVLLVTFDIVVYLRFAASSNWLGKGSLRSFYIQQGSAVDFDCRLSNSSALVNLYRGSKRLTVDGVKLTQVGQKFTLYKIKKNEKGQYQCQSWKKNGHKKFLRLGQSLTVYTYTKGVPTINVSSKAVSAPEKGSATFHCQVISPFVRTVMWFKDMKPLPAQWQSTSRNGSTNTNTLTIANLDVKESGTYECRTEVSFRFQGNNPSFIGFWPEDAKLVVQEFKFLAKNSSPFFVGDVGSSVDINCETNDPNATVSLWKEEIDGSRVNVVPDGTKITKKGSRYGIKNINLQDGRKYVCQATSIYGQTISLDMGILVVLQGGHKDPKAYITPTSKTLVLGESFNFTCHAFGDAIAFTWFKNGSPVPSSMVVAVPPRSYKGYSRFESLLVIKKAQTSTEGVYKCQITSGRQPGYSYNVTANLTILECPKPNGKFADPFDHGGYVHCKNGVATRHRCPSTQYWEDRVKKCVSNPTTPFLRWLSTEDKYQSAAIGMNLLIDCSLTDPSVKTRLSRKDKKQVKVDGVKVIQTGQMFKITNLESKDSATYVCQADGIADQPRVRLYVDADLSRTLRIIMFPSFGVLELETTYTYAIRCRSPNRGKTYWYKVDKATNALTPITNGTVHNSARTKGHKITEWELTLSNVTQKDAGIYMCLKKNSIGVVANETIEVIVKAPIEPDIVTDSTKEVTQHQLLTFTGKITGSPPPNVMLSKGGVTLVTCIGGQAPHCLNKKKGRVSGRWTNDKKSFKMTISGASYLADDGEFVLTARNIAGKKEVKVKVIVNVPPVIFKKKPLQFAHSKSKHNITCAVKASRPNAVFEWEYQPWPCGSTKYTNCDPRKGTWEPIDSRTGKIKLLKGRKSILEVPPSDDFAFYRCKVQNKVGRDNFVFALLRSDKRPDTLKIEEGDMVTKNENDTITLTCTGKFQYSGPPYWMHGNTEITNTSRIRITEKISPSQNTTYLEIFNAQVNDSGTYRCMAPLNKNGTPSADEVQLSVLAVASPSVEFEGQRVNATNTVTLNCTVRGHPVPTITWYKNGTLLEVRSDLQSTSECDFRKHNAYYHLDTKFPGAGNPHTYTLVICGARQENSGFYTCSAVNRAGKKDETAYLEVLAPPKITFERNELHWQIGDRVLVKCFAKGNPKPYVRWLRERNDGLFVPFGNVSKWSKEHKILVIPELRKKDFTSYRCEAKNELGKNKEDILIAQPIINKLKLRRPGTISTEAVIIIAVVSGFVILLLLVVIAVLYRRKKLYGGFYILTLPPMPDYFKKLDPSRPILEQTNKLPLCADWEFPRNRLTLGKIIGSGAFGQVFKSEAVGIVAFDPRSSIKGKSARRRSRFGSTSRPYYNNKQVTTVACKGLKEDATESEYRDLVSELKILMHIGEHKNIVNLLGACTKGRECDLLVIIEFCPHGNLLEFLRKRRDLFEAMWAPATEKPDESFTTTDLVITAFQVARAMEFLASRRCVHRDLAARNVLVGENYVMKVADFGLARDIYKNEHYFKTTSGLLPVKWMAIEALVDRIYTHQSDVWSFGVLLWEIFTLGGSPYPGLPANEVYQYLMEGLRMHQPDDSPEEIYRLMLSCWEHDPNQRPVFSSIVQTVDKLLEEKATQTGEEYLELENEVVDPRENQPYYLQPEEIHSFQPPESPSPFDNLNSPLPPLPQDELEMQQLIRNNSEEDPNSNTKNFVLKDVPKHKIKKHGSYSELDNQKRSDSSGIVSDDEDYESEKEHLMKDYDGVFDSPPPYMNSKPYSDDFRSNYANDARNNKSKDGITRGRQESARYV